jgi:hypothetical protein
MNHRLQGNLPLRPTAWLVPLFLAFGATAAAAQIPPPVRDTLQVDTLAADTLATDTAEVPRLRRMPLLVAPRPASYEAGEWVWDREALLREAPTSLTDLLMRIPAVATFRAGMFVQPEAAAAFGGTAGRVEIELDGYVLDPLIASTFDLSTLPIAQIRELRVQRRIGLLRIRILTDVPEHELPLSRVEAGIGQPPANLFRGLLLAPRVGIGPLGLAVERLDTDGTNRAEPASLFSGWAKWAWTDGERRGVQLELLSTTLQREPDSPWPVERTRQDLTLRARNRFTPELTAEVYAGRSRIDETVPAAAGDTTDRHTDLSAVQAGARLSFQLPEAVVTAALRYRDADQLPRTELILEGAGGLGPVRVGGELGRAAWPGNPATYYALHGVVGPFMGASAFAELTGGDRGVRAVWGDTARVLLSERSGWRAGVSLGLGGRAFGSIAAIGLEQDAALPFGLPFDTAGAPLDVGSAQGLEAYGRLQIVPGWLAIESWITDWRSSAGWTYMPVRSWRTALELHAVPLESGNLEILGRFEGTQRSAALGYHPVRADRETDAFTPLSSYTVFNGYLQIRVIDVRIFLRWEDFAGQEIEDLPGRFHRGPRILYGVKWNLWN